MPLLMRPASPDDGPALTELALRSKGHWGYDEAFLQACRDELTVTADLIDADHVVVAEDLDGIVGFIAVHLGPPDAELMMLFVEPERIGTGAGRLLWTNAVSAAVAGGAHRLSIESDPYAEDFYVAMGAERVGITPSQSIPGRSLPLLSFELPAA